MTIRPDEHCWRVRTKYSSTDFTRQAWERDEVGIWYGGWSCEDLEVALRQDNPKDYLNQTPAQSRLAWEITDNFLHTARRFCKEVKENDWVIVCFDGALHLGKIKGSVMSEGNHPLNQNGELWKFRKVTNKKSFRLLQMPDFYLLIPQAGQGNVFQFQGNNLSAIKILTECENETDVETRFKAMAISVRLDFLGPQAWESLCLGYLILNEDFLPTGLTAGGTLQTFDIVGYSRKNATRIIAQCKKDQWPQKIDDTFLKFAEEAGQAVRAYYFAYGGCTNIPPNIKVISRREIISWSHGEPGAQYLDRFFIKDIAPAR